MRRGTHKTGNRQTDLAVCAHVDLHMAFSADLAFDDFFARKREEIDAVGNYGAAFGTARGDDRGFIG